MAIRLGYNALSSSVHSRLNQGGVRLAKVYERLSSSSRLNSPGDDAAGLAVSQSLNSSARILTQGVRNLNDGISALNLAQSALRELSALTVRQQELAEQAANGVYSFNQRSAMTKEANALASEFNRIVESTSMNGIKLLDGSTRTLSLQFGTGSEDSFTLSFTDELSRTVGSGEFGSPTFLPALNNLITTRAGDLNSDGNQDFVTSGWRGLQVFLGNGNGTFNAGISYGPGNVEQPYSVTLSDFDHDGDLDLATANCASENISILTNNGDGTFKVAVSYPISPHVAGLDPEDITTGDFNNDGILDIVVTNTLDKFIDVFIGNGNASFKAPISYKLATLEGRGTYTADFNRDGNLDVLVSYDTNMNLLLGNGNGSFAAARKLTTGASGIFGAIGDINNDGHKDILTFDWAGANRVGVLLNNGDATFRLGTSFTAGSTQQINGELKDINGDGVLDLVASELGGDTINSFLGNGDGTFFPVSSIIIGGDPHGIAMADFDNDGVLDLVSQRFNASSVAVLLGNSTSRILMPKLDLYDQHTARDALQFLEDQRTRLSLELGSIGALQSSIFSAITTNQTTIENLRAAAARITDADIAEEAASLVREQILQQTSAALLAQANQVPALALVLLRQ